MRTDRFWARALPLAALLLAGPAGPGVAHAAERPPVLALLLQDAEDREQVVTGDHTVEAGQVVDGIVVVGGHLTVRGRVTGNAVVVGGDLRLKEGGLVEGDALVTGGRILEQGGRVRGERRVMDEGGDDVRREIRRAVEEEVNAATATREVPDDDERRERRGRRDDDSWFGSIRKGFAGLISTLAFGLLLAGIGAALTFYGRPYLETVSDTVRAATLRSAVVGLAAGFLAIPAFVVLVVALAVSIVGIPLLLLAVPLYPLALSAAAAMGLLAAAHAIGERTAEQRHRSFELRYRNSYAYLFTGLGMLLTPLVAAHLIRMTGFLGFIGTLLLVVTWAAIWIVVTVGFGAVILSRAGTRRLFATPPVDPSFDPDPLFDEPVGR